MSEGGRPPQTVEELVAEHDHKIRRYIHRISRGRVRQEDMEDLRQMVLARLVQKDYLKKFDPKKAAFSTFLYWPVRSVVVNQFAANSRNPLNQAVGVVESADDDRVSGMLVLEAYDGAVDADFERRMVVQDVLARFRKHLDTQTKPWGPRITLPDGRQARRSLGLVFELWHAFGMDVRELATALAVGPGAVFGYLKRLRVEAARFSLAAGLTV